ncbi:hypothetical protein RRF57_012058 [Xylaria bambusicola]|uniref:Endonuclease/exonuclease/phosphatase domain-containing protein n=1 Tax=Xylaria bambusicola TaxID=326684 RepID=A0AAN7V1A6_9PEZI
MKTTSVLACTLAAAGSASAETIGEINGNRFLSPFDGKKVTNVTGIVTAKGQSGVWLRSLEATKDERVSDGIYVYGSALVKNASIATGDVIVIDGTVSEYRSSAAYLPLTEISYPTVRAILERNRTFAPIVLGKQRSPPTQQLSGLDSGNAFAVPNNKSLVSVVNPVLEPSKYGLDFWESLVGEYVTIKTPVLSVDLTGMVTLGLRKPEAILITAPLDGTKNQANGKLGDELEDITGVVTQGFGFYQIQPLTKLTVTSSLEPTVSGATKLISNGKCSGITVGGYNIENFSPKDVDHVTAVATHIVEYLKTPDLLILQEVQDNNGETNDGTVDSGLTLMALADAIADLSNVVYNYTYVNPVDGENGGAPGGNIRNAYLYRPDVLRLQGGSAAVAGDAVTANEVLKGPKLKYNPGLIDPNNAAWLDSRKPLVAAWELVGSQGKLSKPWWGVLGLWNLFGPGKNRRKTLFTVNVHFTSKGGSSSLHGDARPPVNGGVEQRIAQATVAGEFISKILDHDDDALVLTVGDFNEYGFAPPVQTFARVSGLRDLDEVAKIPIIGTLFELDHTFVSKQLGKGAKFEHLHVNTWLAYSDQVSDHDPSVAKFDIC